MSIVVSAGQTSRTFEVNPANFWNFDGRHILEGNAVPDGDSTITIEARGAGTIYYSVWADYFTLEEHITPAGNEIFVERQYEKLVREETGTTEPGKANYKDTYVPLSEGDTLNPGDEVRVTLNIRSLNDYQYLVFEDFKPAGFEPVQLTSGHTYGNGLCSNMELRDQWVAFFITHLPQGQRTIQYNLRAEIPGHFHTMPTKGYAMYFPPLRTNSSEIIINVKDK